MTCRFMLSFVINSCAVMYDLYTCRKVPRKQNGCFHPKIEYQDEFQKLYIFISHRCGRNNHVPRGEPSVWLGQILAIVLKLR